MSEIIEAELSEDSARSITNEIKTAGARFYDLVWKAHQGKAWKVLGHDSWRDYVVKELEISKSRSFQILSFIQTRQLIAESTSVDLPANEAQTRPLSKLKTGSDKLTVWTQAVRKAGGQAPSAPVVEECVDSYIRGNSRYRDDRTDRINREVQIAKQCGTTVDDLWRAAAIKKKNPEIFARVRAGELDFDQAEELLKTDNPMAGTMFASQTRTPQQAADDFAKNIRDIIMAEHNEEISEEATRKISDHAFDMMLVWITAARLTAEKGIPLNKDE